ncbi:MAG: pilus assembly protein PilM [Proteobacteria bacterium]|nr:pilus assembly protein PilM [Pseudomonadota bacterium]
MPHRIIGIDLGSYAVKVAVIERSFRSFAFTEFYERRIQYNELLSPEESTAIALQGMIDDYGLHWDVASIGFPSQKVTSRLLTFPFSSSKKIDQTVHFEIESFIPFEMDQIVLDYTTAWQSKDASRVMAVYVQKGELVKLLTMLSTVDVDPRYVSVDGVDYIGLVNLGMVPPEGAYAIIDMGHTKTTVTIGRGKGLGYVRAISIAGKAVTAAISERLSVPYEEAERLKIEMGHLPLAGEEVVDEISRGVSEAIVQVMQEIMLHLRQTLFTYHETEGVPVEGIYLCGGTSRLPGLDRYLSDALKLNVAFLSCSEFHFSRLDRAEAHRHVIPQALALSLRAAAGTGADINLRQGDLAFKGDVEQFGGNIRKIGFIAGIIVFLALINFTAKYYSVKRQLDRMGSDVVALVRQAVPGAAAARARTPTAAIALVKGREQEVDLRMEELSNLVAASPLDVLKELSLLMPPREDLSVEVVDLNISADRVTMEGVVSDFKTVDTVRQALEKSGFFINVTSGNVRKGVKGEVKFTMSMDVARKGE